MKCPNCGAQGLDNYCEYCGTKLNNNVQNGYQPFTYNYNYYYTNNQQQPFAANPGKYANSRQSPPPPHPPYNHFQQQQRYDANAETNRSEKSILICLLLCLIGLFGTHRFYVGKIWTGMLYLFTFWSIGIIGMVIDLILIACGVFRDADGKTLKW